MFLVDQLDQLVVAMRCLGILRHFKNFYFIVLVCRNAKLKIPFAFFNCEAGSSLLYIL